MKLSTSNRWSRIESWCTFGVVFSKNPVVPFLDLYDTNDLEITNLATYCTRLGPHLLMRTRFLSKHTPISIEVAPMKHGAWCMSMIHVSWPAMHFGRSFGKVFARLCSATDTIIKTINSCLKVLRSNRKALKMSFQLKQKPNWYSSASYFPYILLHEIQTMFSQLAKRWARALPANLRTDHAHYVKIHRSTVFIPIPRVTN